MERVWHPLLHESSDSHGYGTWNDDNTVNANDSSINARTKLSRDQQKRQEFMQLLRETSCVSSHSSWEDTKDSFKEDPRFQAVGDDALSEDWFNEFRQIREDFMQLLRETSWVSSHVSWRVTEDSLKWDPRFRAVGDDKLSEEWFNEFRQNLIREDFMQLLRETSWVSNHYSWQDTKDSLKRDPRFQAVGDEKLAEKWFIEVRQDLIRQDFMKLLRETPWIHSQSSWDVTREALKLDRFKAVADVALFEKLFIEFKKHLKRHDFMQLLRDTPCVRSSSWEEAKKDIEKDQRYVATGDVADEEKWFDEFKKSLPFKKLLHDTPGIERNSSWQIAKEVLKSKQQFLDDQDDALREECFNEFKMNMLPWHKDENGGNKTWIKLLLRVLVFSPFKRYRGSCWISLPHFLVCVLHVAKLVLTTIAVVTFGGCREQLSDAITHGQLALKHNLLKEYETPSNGPFAVYKVDDFIDRINFAVEGYYNMEYQATGNFKILSIDQIDMSFRYIASSESTVEIKSLGFEPKYGLTNDTKNGHAVYKYDVLRELEHYNLTDVFDNTLDVTLTASLHSFRVLRKGAFLCLRTQINIEYSDIDFNGEVDIELRTTTTTAACQRMNINATDAAMCDGNSLYSPVVFFVVVTCVLDGLSVFTGLIMFCKYCGTANIKNFGSHLMRWWSLVSFIGDGIILIGQIMLHKENNERGEMKLRSFDEIAFFSGIGCLLCWMGAMRYWKINRKFSLLFHTIYYAKSSILAFVLCTGTLSIGYWACAFATLGVYHPKFETKSLAAVSLFSLMYGDDILGTVTSVHYENAGSEIYLKLSVIIVIYSFVILFTLLALNLIIALINTSYTTVNEIDQKDDEDGETVSMFCFLNGEEAQKRPERFHIWWYGERYKSCCCNSCFET